MGRGEELKMQTKTQTKICWSQGQSDVTSMKHSFARSRRGRRRSRLLYHGSLSLRASQALRCCPWLGGCVNVTGGSGSCAWGRRTCLVVWREERWMISVTVTIRWHRWCGRWRCLCPLCLFRRRRTSPCVWRGWGVVMLGWWCWCVDAA